MRRFIPHPLLALLLFVTWLLLTQSFSPGQMLLGAIVAFLATQAMAALKPEPVKLRQPAAMAKLLAIVVPMFFAAGNRLSIRTGTNAPSGMRNGRDGTSM